MSSIVCRDHARKTLSGPGEVQQGPGVSSSDYGPLSVLRSACHPQQGHQAPYQPSFHQEVLCPQVGAGRDTTAARGWPTAGNRRIAATSRAPQLIYKGWSVAYDPLPTSGRPSPKPKISKSTRSVTDKSSRVQLMTLKKRS